jgi:hypothetical protein
MIPTISSDAANAGLPIDPTIVSGGTHARRNSESKASTSAPEAVAEAVPQSLSSQNSAADAAAANVSDSSLDIPDAQAADAIMASLRAGILAQPGTAMQAQGGLSPRSVYDLLQ